MYKKKKVKNTPENRKMVHVEAEKTMQNIPLTQEYPLLHISDIFAGLAGGQKFSNIIQKVKLILQMLGDL